MRFVHLSNARLFSENEENKFQIDFAEERWAAFQNVIRMCRDTMVEALFLTGNVFASAPTALQVETLDELLVEAKGTRVFILTGDCDASTEDSPLATHEWAGNTQVFIGDCIQRVYVQKLGIEITGIGYCEQTWDKVTLSKLSRGRKGKYQFLLLPTLEGKGSADEIRALNLPFDYVGVGGAQVIAGEMGDHVYAPGEFAAQTFSNQIEHGYFLGDVAENKEKQATIRFVPSDCREYIALQIRVDESSTVEKVSGDVQRIIKKYGEKNIYHIALIGTGSPEFYFEKKALFDLGLIADVNDPQEKAVALDRLGEAHGDDALGRFLTEMRTGEGSKAREKALDYGIDALLQAQKEAKTC